MSQTDHERFMRRAIALAANAPALPFGSVVVRVATGEILAEGWNRSALNPTGAGEIDAPHDLFRAGRIPGGELALYTTAEPCPMCMAAILWSGIELVAYGTS